MKGDSAGLPSFEMRTNAASFQRRGNWLALRHSLMSDLNSPASRFKGQGQYLPWDTVGTWDLLPLESPDGRLSVTLGDFQGRIPRWEGGRIGSDSRG